MSLAQVFFDMGAGAERNRDRRIDLLRNGHKELSEVDAFIIDEYVVKTAQGAMKYVGEQLDGLAPRLRLYAIPLVLDIVPNNLHALESRVTEIVLGLDRPTPGCDCEICKAVKALQDELLIAEKAVAEQRRG